MSPQRAKTPCLVCNLPTLHGSRCPTHCTTCPTHRRRGPSPYAAAEYQRNRRRLMTQHLEEHGWWCPGAPDLDHAPHPSRTLTVDHIVRVADGGTHELGNLRVLCWAANRRRG